MEHSEVGFESLAVVEEQELSHSSHFFLDYSISGVHCLKAQYVHGTCMSVGWSSMERLCRDHSASTLVDPELEEDD